jgi:hypothetical protein
VKSTAPLLWYNSAMIRQPTVIVFGAGASSSYGFPFGDQMIQKIHQQLNPKQNTWIPKLIECGISDEKIEEFRKALLLSQPYSVDSFLEHRPEFIEVGKLIIALSLIPMESDYRLFPDGSASSGCYRYIFNQMKSGTAGYKEFNDNKLSIITFNYDRSFEHYLYTAFQNTYGISFDECTAVLREVPIIHVHGTLGKLPWQSSDAGEEKRDYIPETDIKDIQIAAAQIKIISEGSDTSEEFKTAIQYLHGAEKVYFLGFGYNSTNLSRLKINKMPTEMRGMDKAILAKRQIRGSAYNIGASVRAQIESDWKILLPDYENMNCLEFLQNHALLA